MNVLVLFLLLCCTVLTAIVDLCFSKRKTPATENRDGRTASSELSVIPLRRISPVSFLKKKSATGLLTLLLLCTPTLYSQDTLTITTYNLLNYTTADLSRDQYFRTILRHATPDILIVQEMTSQSALNNLYDNVIRVVFPGQFSQATFLDGPDSDNALFFRAAKLDFISNTPIRTALRDINEFTLFHRASAETLRVYSVHLKASSGAANEAQRAAEVDSLRNVTNTFPAGKYFIVVGDFNIYGSAEAAYQKLLQDNPADDGNFHDPITITGTWNNAANAIYHTQSPRIRSFGGGATGGLDDRFDMILHSTAMTSGSSGRVRYIESSMTSIGNDGNHYNDSINRLPNSAVPDSVANALHYASDHLPVSARFVFTVTPVPIQLASFTASVVPHLPSAVRLLWRTLTETNSYGFYIQRKRSTDSDFIEIQGSFVPGNGTTTEPHQYSYTDTDGTPGLLHYRLRHLDLDGTVHFTEPVSITVASSVAESRFPGFELQQNYPNPFNRTTTIEYTLPSQAKGGESFHVLLRVYDVLGREVATLVDETQDPGEKSVRWNVGEISSGVYCYRLKAGAFVSTRHMVLIK